MRIESAAQKKEYVKFEFQESKNKTPRLQQVDDDTGRKIEF